MSVRCVILASVSSAFLAACVAASGPAFASSKEPNVARAEQAYTALAAGDQTAAIAAYSQAIESQKLPPEVLANSLLNRGLAHQQLAEYQEAIDDYTSALRLDAMDATIRATALYNRGLSQLKLEKSSAAIEDFTSALFLDPTFAQAYYSRGNALRQSGQSLFALSDYDKALRYHHPDVARVYYAQALAFEDLKRPNDVRKSLELAVAANPQFAPAGQKLASLQGMAPVIAVAEPVRIVAMNSVGGEITVRKPDLPKAVAPTDELLSTTQSDPIETAAVDPVAVKPGKKYTDRVPVEEAVAAAPAAAAPEEKIVAIEMVNDDAPASDAEPAMAENAVVEPASAEPAATEAPPATGWSVQVASAASENAAWSTWKNMQAKHRNLASQKPVVVKADLGSKGIFYRVRLAGFDDQNAAKSTCSKLKASGVACFVSKLNS